jgi:type I restriction enzyme R subunit
MNLSTAFPSPILARKTFDRVDLDGQIYGTFAGCCLVNNDKQQVRAGTGADLKSLLALQKPYVFTLIHRFNQEVSPNDPYSDCDDIIVITDEAHRTQNGLLSLNMRNALPNASFLGFTGTPLMTGDETTKQTFGNYISTYDFQRAEGQGHGAALLRRPWEHAGCLDPRPEREDRGSVGRV